MANKKDSVIFGQKLNWLKTTLGVTDGEIGAVTGASAPLVCRWRSGERSLDPTRDAGTLQKLADFFLRLANERGKTEVLTNALSIDADALSAKYILAFMFDGKQIVRDGKDGNPLPPPPPVGQICYFGMDGILSAVSLLGEKMTDSKSEIVVYLSLEHAGIFREPDAARLWDELVHINGGRPIRVVFDTWSNTAAGEAAKTLLVLMSFAQKGLLRLHLVKSTQKFFYNNISFFVNGAGMVITAGPVIGGGIVSMPVDSPEYISGIGALFAKLDRNTKPVDKHLAKDESIYYSRLYEPGSNVRAVIDGANLLYLDADAYLNLLKLNGITISQRTYRMEKFQRDKQQFELFLESGHVTEIFSLTAFDRMIAEHKMTTPDFSFSTGGVKTNAEILKSLLTGMLDALERHGNLSVYLNRQGLPQVYCSQRIKGDSFALLHSYENGDAHAVYTDTWLAVYEYIRQFDEAVHDTELITTSDAVKTALKIRIESLRG